MASKIAIKAIPMSSVASTALTGSFQVLSPAIGAPCHMIKIINNSDEDVFVSFDYNPNVASKVANDFVPKGTVALIPPYQGYPNTNSALWSSSNPVYILGSTGMTGSIYLAGYYQGV
jgi:hypothetical protein